MKKIVLLWSIFLLAYSCSTSEDWDFPSFFWGFAIEGFPITQNELIDLRKETRITPEMILFYLQWDSKEHKAGPLTTSLENIWQNGAVPCITWEPMSIVGGAEKIILYEDILKGSYDPYILAIAEEVKKWGKPVLIRFAHEMNLSRYHWGTELKDFGPDSPEIYKKMFAHVVNLFKTHLVKNALWVFCPNVDSIPNAGWNTASKYYPGNQFVDILGMDGYNWDIGDDLAAERKLTWTSPWKSFEEIFSPLYHQLKVIAPHKPIIVFETASSRRAGHQKRAQWIQEALTVAKKWRIKGLVWFQVDKEETWRLGIPPEEPPYPLIHPSKPSLQEWLSGRPAQ